jgi:predicted RNA methylase
MGTKGTTKSQGQKHALDKFYTKSHVAKACLELLDLGAYDLIIEPSAGGGAFSDPLFAGPSPNVLAFDLDPENPGVHQQDWFEYTTRGPAATLVVGNPPFGQQCSLALAFINHAFETVGAQTVAFILPRSFRKPSVQSRVFKHARLTQEVILARNSFELDGEDYELNTVFQVWERADAPRSGSALKLESRYFSFTKKNVSHDFAVRRVGGRAGHAFIDGPDTSEQSNYFLKLKQSRPIEDVVSMVNGLDFSVADDGTGPRTLSKGELVELFDAGYTRQFGR